MARHLILLFAAAAATLLGLVVSSRAQEEITVNNLPCNVACQIYMGVGPHAKDGYGGPPAYVRQQAPAPQAQTHRERRSLPRAEREDGDDERLRLRVRRAPRPHKALAAHARPCGAADSGEGDSCERRQDAKVTPAPPTSAAAAEPPATPMAPKAVATLPPSASPPPAAKGSDYYVLIVLADGADTKLSDLNQKTVTIVGPASLSQEAVARALAAAGVASAKVSAGSKKDVDNLVKGLVPAAVVACLPPAKAQAFPVIAGLTMFKVLVAKSDATCL